MADIFTILLTICGLALFETISSIDNAIINAEVLGTMKKASRKWFLTYGMLSSVFVVRGLLPWLIVWIATPSLSPLKALTATFSSDPTIVQAIDSSSPILLIGGGVFLISLFLHWLFLEPKSYGLPSERFFEAQGVWFFAILSVILASIVWLSLKISPMMAFGAVIGSTIFFITHGFKQNAEKNEQGLIGSGLSDISKLFYLEVIDTTFSVDGVLGAFAFTLAVPLIMIGSGLGAIIVRQLTMGNIEAVKKYVFLKNGAMYSILVLGTIMLMDSFNLHVPSWLSPIATFAIIGFFYLKSFKQERAS
ncbi:MAG: DUF475 domain-containing protein [Candidatus Andersenbacteria bacterium]|nr:DUF475 domain-containing protein [Candidatus Andersenbacteria bacterium]